jgi:hypothetical protein
MVYQFKLQIPISRELNKKLKSRVAKTGLSSVNDVARLLLTSYADGDLDISVVKNTPGDNWLGYDLTELDAIVAQGMAEHKAGKTKSLDFSKNIHEQLMAD